MMFARNTSMYKISRVVQLMYLHNLFINVQTEFYDCRCYCILNILHVTDQ